MKNLESLNYDELTNDELISIEGGFVCAGACIVGLAAGAAFLTGVSIGIDLYENSHD